MAGVRPPLLYARPRRRDRPVAWRRRGRSRAIHRLPGFPRPPSVLCWRVRLASGRTTRGPESSPGARASRAGRLGKVVSRATHTRDRLSLRLSIRCRRRLDEPPTDRNRRRIWQPAAISHQPRCGSGRLGHRHTSSRKRQNRRRDLHDQCLNRGHDSVDTTRPEDPLEHWSRRAGPQPTNAMGGLLRWQWRPVLVAQSGRTHACIRQRPAVLPRQRGPQRPIPRYPAARRSDSDRGCGAGNNCRTVRPFRSQRRRGYPGVLQPQWVEAGTCAEHTPGALLLHAFGCSAAAVAAFASHHEPPACLRRGCLGRLGSEASRTSTTAPMVGRRRSRSRIPAKAR